jgi:hypothetical protein
MCVAGVFLIQRLEGSLLGTPTLWVLNGSAKPNSWGVEESIGGSDLKWSWWQNSAGSHSREAGGAGTRVAMMFGDVLVSG